MKTTQKVPTYKILQLKTNKTFKEYQHLFGFGESFDVTEENVSKEYQDKSPAVLQTPDHHQIRIKVCNFPLLYW